MKKITVIGTGNGGLATAFNLAGNGNKVCIYDTENFNQQIEEISLSGGIKGGNSNVYYPDFEKIELATTDVKSAMAFADIVFIVCPSYAQETLFEKIIPYMRTGMTIIMMPGNYGGLILKRMMEEKNMENLELAFVDAITLPWTCRIIKPGVINIMGKKRVLPLSIDAPEEKKESIKNQLEDILSIDIEMLDNSFISGLENINFCGHTVMTILNMGLLENLKDEFLYYRDCCSEKIAKVYDRLDNERITVGNALGIEIPTELQMKNHLYGTCYKTVLELNYNQESYKDIKNMNESSKKGFLADTVPYLLVPCYEIGKIMNVETPLLEALITIASVYNDTDYFKTGRRLEQMFRKEDITKENLIKIFNKL